MKNKKSILKIKGFTLIEMLVVVLIIGILAAIAVPQYQKAVMKTRYANLKALTRSIAEAQKAYYLATGEYTEEISNLDITLSGATQNATDPRKYDFDWGFCASTLSDESKINVVCRNYDISMGYHITVRPSIIGTSCYIYGETLEDAKNKNIQNQICKSETALTKYTAASYNDFSGYYLRYKYP